MLLIRPITKEDWPHVDAIQKETYPPQANEDIETIKCHWKLSPKTCFVATEHNTVIAYLIAHPWKMRTQPPINTIYSSLGDTNCIYLHDIAINKLHQKTGLGQKLVLKLFEAGTSLGYSSYCLISVQGTRPFWEKLGFIVVTSLPLDYFNNIVNLYPDSQYYYMEKTNSLYYT
jgi:predicted N-acetyltransferase YhbS